MMVVVSFAPHRAVELLTYQLLILRTSKQFKGLAWRDYDEPFHRDAAARAISDWSRVHMELYNYHTAALSQAPVLGHRWTVLKVLGLPLALRSATRGMWDGV